MYKSIVILWNMETGNAEKTAFYSLPVKKALICAINQYNGNFKKREIIKKAVNRFELDFIGANNAALNLDNNKIFLIGGYTPENGLYCRLY